MMTEGVETRRERISPEDRIAELGFSLPELPAPAGRYVSAVRTGGLVITSSISAKRGARVRFPGRVGEDIDLETGRVSAVDALLNCLSVIRTDLGSLDAVERMVRMVGYVNSAPGFHDQHLVMDAASELLLKVFGSRGEHVRAALGVCELPLRCSVGVELWAEVRADSVSDTHNEEQ